MLYTRKGDSGTTKFFDSAGGERVSKSSCRTEALGALDELNSFLGWVKTQTAEWRFSVGESKTLFRDILGQIQKDLFIIQAELAGAPKAISSEKILWLERLIAEAEQSLPPIKSFVIAGRSEVSALLDVVRAIARRAERRVVEAKDRFEVSPAANTLAYLNRVSSLLYALARLANVKVGLAEESPDYS
jgi:cob(I)alamin adenosyltransferase